MTIRVIDTMRHRRDVGTAIHFVCPHCGCLVCDEDAHATDGLDCGTTVKCPECGQQAVVDIRTPEERTRAFQDTGAVDALRELESATYAFAMAATVELNRTTDEFPPLVQALAGARTILQPEVEQ